VYQFVCPELTRRYETFQHDSAGKVILQDMNTHKRQKVDELISCSGHVWAVRDGVMILQ